MWIYHDDNIVFLINMMNIINVIDIEDDDRNIIMILMDVLGMRLFVVIDMLFIMIRSILEMLRNC